VFLTTIYCTVNIIILQTAHKKQESAAAADGVVELGQDGSFDAAASPHTKAATAVTADAEPAAEAAAAAKALVSTAGAADASSSDKPRKFCDVQCNNHNIHLSCALDLACLLK
jgi:hypothetical protein